MTNKTCTGCGLEKAVSEFWISNKKRGYIRSTCKECDKAYQRLQYATSAVFREKARANSVKNYKPKSFQKSRADSLKHKFGLSIAEYDAMVKAQGGKCALCRSSDTGRNKPDKKWKAGHWNVDHCHKTGRVRGLLCHTCNVRVGAYERLMDLVGLPRLISYLVPPDADRPQADTR